MSNIPHNTRAKYRRNEHLILIDCDADKGCYIGHMYRWTDGIIEMDIMGPDSKRVRTETFTPAQLHRICNQVSDLGEAAAKHRPAYDEQQRRIWGLEQQLAEQARYHEVAIGTLRDSNDELEQQLDTLREALDLIINMDNQMFTLGDACSVALDAVAKARKEQSNG